MAKAAAIKNSFYYIGPAMPLVFQSLATLIALLLAFLGAFIWPFKRFFRFFKKGGHMYFILMVVALISAVIFGTLWAKNTGKSNTNSKVVILGMDGLDPKILEQMMTEGKLPNFSKLKQTGSYHRLATTNPAQSPVAWSSFITGTNPGGHNIFDFLRRDPETYMPDLCLAKSEPPKYHFKLGKIKISLGRSRISSYRKGIPFWEILSKNNIPSVILRCPMTFPPDKIYGRMLSGFGVPDLQGTQGTFSYYTTENALKQETGGKVIQINIDSNHTINTLIYGPIDSSSKEFTNITMPLKLKINRDRTSVTILLQGRQEEIKKGEWSNWWRVSFKTNWFTRTACICRFYLKSIEPHFELYLSPLNFDPEKPVFCISHPPSYSKKLAQEIGLYHTLGQPGETWALNSERIDEQTAIEQYSLVLRETEHMLFTELGKFQSGVLFCYFGISDIIQHMFWRFMDQEHPMYNEALILKYKDVIPNMYRRMDEILGKVIDQTSKDTTIIVLSDHGFGTFRRAVHLNSWLRKNDLLQFKPSYKPTENNELFSGIDWQKTKAYAVGLGGIYINQRGRESQGIVEPGMEAEKLKSEIVEKLQDLIDPKTGTKAIRKVYKKEEIFYGPHTQNAPDMVVGFNIGHRVSWQTALGGTPTEIFEDNRKKWSGDHIFDPALVPGILLISKKSKLTNPRIIDLAPTILQLFEIKTPKEMDGKPLL